MAILQEKARHVEWFTETEPTTRVQQYSGKWISHKMCH